MHFVSMQIFRKKDKSMRNRVLCGRGFQAMPSLDNVALIDFCVAKLHYCARILGCIIPMPSVLAILWDTHRFLGLIRSSGVDLAPKKIQFYKNLFLTRKKSILDHRPGSKSLLPRGCNQGWPHGLKSVWHTSFGP